MKVEDFTYEHQIIRQADYLTSTVSDSKIGGSPLHPTTIFLVKLFCYIHKTDTPNIIETDSFPKLREAINEYCNSTINKNTVNALTTKVKEELEEIISEDAQLDDSIIDLEFLILLRYLDEDDSYNFLPSDLIEMASKKINLIGNKYDFQALLEVCSNSLQEDRFPISPINDIRIESLIQLALNNIINTQEIDKEFYKKIKARKLKFIKNVYDKLDMFKDPYTLMHPGQPIIEGILSTAITLLVLNYRYTISLNRIESENYIDKEIGEKMIEQEIHNRIEEERKKITNFTISIPFFAYKSKVPLFYVVSSYLVLWSIFSFFLYIRNAHGIEISLGALAVFSGYFLYESYKKSKPLK